ncbi:hypothetical protein Pcinc_022283 [Petrolisthes cinctipes]|uniref:Uncharacterized protein n=1 Tax=Petrolisthes cinctipes TaxID=88211 RepID=A0AAE1FF23_PETCI|nr:hypothetical protein Pcinc_022283 [Petrolisthes cinctipes]
MDILQDGKKTWENCMTRPFLVLPPLAWGYLWATLKRTWREATRAALEMSCLRPWCKSVQKKNNTQRTNNFRQTKKSHQIDLIEESQQKKDLHQACIG